MVDRYAGNQGFGLIDFDGAEIARYFLSCSIWHRVVPIIIVPTPMNRDVR